MHNLHSSGTYVLSFITAGLPPQISYHTTKKADIYSFKLTMNDLLSELFENPQGQGYGGGDVEMSTQREEHSWELGLDDFFKKVQAIQKQYKILNKLQKKLQDAHEESKAVTKAAAMKAIKEQMEKDVDEVGKIAQFIKSKIEELLPDHSKNVTEEIRK